MSCVDTVCPPVLHLALLHCLCYHSTSLSGSQSATEDWRGRRTLCLRPGRYTEWDVRGHHWAGLHQAASPVQWRAGLELVCLHPGNNITSQISPPQPGRNWTVRWRCGGWPHLSPTTIIPSCINIRSSELYSTSLHQELYYVLGIKVTSRLVYSHPISLFTL